MESVTVEVGDMLVAMTGDTKRPVRFGVIESLEADRQSLTRASGTPSGIEVGIKVPFRTKVNHTFLCIPKSKWS